MASKTFLSGVFVNMVSTFFFFCFCFLMSFEFSEAQMVPAMYVFGDSLVDVGNNNYLPISIAKADFPHNGIDFPTKKATGRFSNGKNAADLLAQKMGLPTSPPYLSAPKKNTSSFITGVSFASGGAGIFNGSDQTLGQSIPLTKQVGDYESAYADLVGRLGSSGAQTHAAKSLFFIVIGSNDIFDYSPSNDKTPQEYVNLMLLTLKGLLKRLHNSGARKFSFAGVAAIGCTPSSRANNKTQECDEGSNAMAVLYNQGLKSMLQQLKSELNDMVFSYFDTYAVFESILQKPSKYGFTEVKAACCGLGTLNAKIPCIPISKYCPNRKDHVFWDLFHPTEATAMILVDAIFDGPPQYTFPMNVRKLLSAN